MLVTVKTYNRVGSVKLLLQSCVLGFGSEEDGDVGVRVYPDCEEVLISGAAFFGVSPQGAGAGETEMRQRCNRLWLGTNDTVGRAGIERSSLREK